MEHIAALLLIVGCSGDLKQCTEMPAPVTIFETAEECQGVLPMALRDAKGKHTRTFATCVPVDPAMEEEDAELTWDVLPSGKLVAEIGAPNVVVASNPARTDKNSVRQQ
jgi:hypothetical protein